MSRIKLTDGSNRWFTLETAEEFKEDTFWNGHNWISCATEKAFYHERLYYTKGKRYILCKWADVQGAQEEAIEIEAWEAAEWFVKNNYENPHPACAAEFNDLEIK